MDLSELKSDWLKHYAGAPETLKGLGQIRGVASTFNANIDAVIKVSPERLLGWLAETGVTPADIDQPGKGFIRNQADFFKGFIRCFEGGSAQEWIVTDVDVYHWMHERVGYDHLQMGGQGGIIANVMAVAGVQRVYVHGAAMPDEQTRLFLNRDNLLAATPEGTFVKAIDATRDEEPLIHWILEFDKGAVIEWEGHTWTCPKSNRFIATYDPLNLRLHIDDGFDKALGRADEPLDLLLLSGYQMLVENLPGGERGLDRIEDSWKQIAAWKELHPDMVIHFEFASTQDRVIRKALAEGLATRVDSVGLNEQETIQILNVLGETDLVERCRENLHSVALFEGTRTIFEQLGVPRIQLHMFGLYVTLVRPGSGLDLEAQRTGMALAATIAAAKAGTGDIEVEEELMWGHGRAVADVALKELEHLAEHLEANYGISNIASTGISTLR